MNKSPHKISYLEYLKSPTWHNIRSAALEHYGTNCAKCNQYGTDVHHLIYPDIRGEESMEDLMVLCRDCHEAIHSAQRGCAGFDSLHVIGLYNYLTEKQKEILSLNLQDSLYYIFMSDTPEGERVRKMALKLLNVERYYGLKRNYKNEKYLTPKQSKKIYESKKIKEFNKSENLKRKIKNFYEKEKIRKNSN